MSEMVRELRNEASGLRVFYVFYWCKKQKIELFFYNDLKKSLQNGPKHPKTVFKCHFDVFYGNWGANIGDFDHFGDFWSKILICPSLNGLGYLWGGGVDFSLYDGKMPNYINHFFCPNRGM